MTRASTFTPLVAAACLGLTAACTLSAPQAAPRPDPALEVPTRWDHRPEADMWTAATFDALENGGSALVQTVPRDIDVFCPGYAQADAAGRKAFWTALFSGLAGFESTWRPEAAGAGGRYRGLLQIWPTTARNYGCDLSHPNGLFDGATNLRCASRIAADAVARDQVVAGTAGAWGGVARHWPPLRRATIREDIANFTRNVPACSV
ncbi:MAG: transglycosylase SLT domain-containing protein [Roseinatronobacter sp.]